jgi:hypothetical protein
MPFIGNQPARIPLTSADITDGIIVNADVSSTAGITLNKISGNTGFKNVIINGGFIINQRGYTSGTALASGSYGHDRWKGGASGGTYTFTAGSTGVNTTLTITAGSIIQVIEGANLPVSGTYVLSWTGTAQGKIGSGSFSSSGVTGTITAGTNTNIEFNTGTCGNVQLELGSVASSFDYRSFGTELLLCQRYFQFFGGSSQSMLSGGAMATNSTTVLAVIPLIQEMRTNPTLTFSSTASAFRVVLSNDNSIACTAVPTANVIGKTAIRVALTVSGGLTAGNASILFVDGSALAFIAAAAEL